jgi:3-oxoacyl-[acyl-carrier-protein] synthase-3
MASAVREVVRQANLKLEDINLIVPHQANRRIIDNSARALKLPADKFFINVDRYANTSAASIPIAVCEAIAQKRLHPNDYVVLVGFGAGLTWAASAIKWNVTPPVEVSRWRRYLRQAAYLLARGRSLLLRGWRHIEAMFYGSQSPEGGQEPPHRSPPPDDKAPKE